MEASKGTIRYVELVDLLFNIVALNVFVFTALPIMSGVLNLDGENMPLSYNTGKKQM